MKNRSSVFSCFILSAFLLFSSIGTGSANGLATVDMGRNRMIGYMISRQLPGMHFSDKQMDDSLSRAAFDLYLKQLDFQKRFLLQQDIDVLSTYSQSIDDELLRGNVTLPQKGFDLLTIRIQQVEKMVAEILAADIDVTQKESYETDPEKLTYATDDQGLREYWRKILKEQIISKYLDALTEQQAAKEKKSDELLWKEARERVAKQNKQFFHRLHQETLQDHFDRYFDAVARAFDPHTDYMPPDNKEDFDIHMRGSLEGIGAVLREEDGYIKVVSIIPGSASARQGHLEAEDSILEVAQKNGDPVEITDMRLRDAVRLIRGPKGTEVRLTVKKPDGVKVVISLIRDVVQIEETFVKSVTLDAPVGGKIGYVMIPSFYRDFEGTKNGTEARNCTEDTRKAIEDLKKTGINGLILDLRNNGGGSLVDAVDTAGLFIKSGPVVQVKNSSGVQRILSDEDPEIVYDGPLVVLVNQFSASASEIVAAALQDYGRAVIIGGRHTHGKGTVQTLVDMNENIPTLHLRSYDDLGALKVTIQKFYRVNGGSTQYKGVESDIALPSLFQYLKSGEQYIDYSLPWDQVEPVPFVKFSDKKIDLNRLIAASERRVKFDPGLQAIADEAKKAEERSKDTVVSLQLSDMKKRREEAELARKKIGSHYRKYRVEKEGAMGEETENGAKKGDDHLKWLEEVKDDPYIAEAMRILVDMNQP
ncbi:MAG: carboxy terminal-processing peptidase [Proteobacteria bacterium]|nr:carboxy terminal-processing peptidase [Pseudomonadota bacterium]MBU1647881.1 carboxy terminal-processing peptidase [Pseudomonadota bacterium]